MGVQKLIEKFLKTGSVNNLILIIIILNIREDMTNCAEELRQHIRNAVASLTIEEIRNIPM
jgi:hypothetical protein